MEHQVIGNKLIADFMGVKIGEDQYSWRPGCTEPLKESHLAYHKEWGWLMPVVEKINTLAIDNYGEIGVWITPTQCKIGEDEHNPITMTTVAYHPKLIDMVWVAVKTFLQWYSTQNK